MEGLLRRNKPSLRDGAVPSPKLAHRALCKPSREKIISPRAMQAHPSEFWASA